MTSPIKIIVAGGRDFDDWEYLYDTLDNVICAPIEVLMGLGHPVTGEIPTETPKVQIVSGGAKGADALGEEWSRVDGHDLIVFPADWEKHGKAAGAIRNKQMAEYADVLVAFWDGKSKGTKNMIDTALSEGLDVHIYRYSK